MPENARTFLDLGAGEKIHRPRAGGFGICYLREEGNAASGIRVRFRDRLMFPIRNEIGDVIAFSGRQLRGRSQQRKIRQLVETLLFRKSKVLFRAGSGEKADSQAEGGRCFARAVGCDFHANELGIDHAIALAGHSIHPRARAACCVANTNHVLVCYDADSAGLKAAERTFRELAGRGCRFRVVCMPAGMIRTRS